MKTKSIILSAFMALLFVPAAMAVDPSVDVPASVELGTPITLALRSGTSLNFARLSIPASGSATAVLDPTTVVVTATGSTATGTASVAIFDVAGKASTAYAITLPSAPVALTSAATTIYLSAFTATKATPTLGTTGTDEFSVGATVSFASTDADGIYTGTFPVTVAYN